MMQHHVSIQARFSPEVLERILRVVRYRGFNVTTMQMTSDQQPDHIDLALTLNSHRPVHLLTAQLSKLVDVTSVTTR